MRMKSSEPIEIQSMNAEWLADERSTPVEERSFASVSVALASLIF